MSEYLVMLQGLIDDARERYGVKIMEMRMNPQTERAIRSEFLPAASMLTSVLGIDVVVDPLCPSDSVYMCPGLEVEMPGGETMLMPTRVTAENGGEQA